MIEGNNMNERPSIDGVIAHGEDPAMFHDNMAKDPTIEESTRRRNKANDELLKKQGEEALKKRRGEKPGDRYKTRLSKEQVVATENTRGTIEAFLKDNPTIRDTSDIKRELLEKSLLTAEEKALYEKEIEAIKSGERVNRVTTLELSIATVLSGGYVVKE